MDLINGMMKIRQAMYKPAEKPTKTSDETDGLTLATIIEKKPKRSEVIKYFRTRSDQCDGSAN